tara:strand:+ start:462 stop:1118 length:657 start_codon:yes stop_codon:yes gene_type:complete
MESRKKLKVLVACEYSGIVRDEFLKLGHDAVSCDMLESESNYDGLGSHYVGDVKEILNDGWDLMIAHPPCTYLAITGAWTLYNPKDMHLQRDNRREHPDYPNRRQKMFDGLHFVKLLMDAPIDKICIENPNSLISTYIRSADQIIQPYQFGDLESKKTFLWLKNLPPLVKTNDRTNEIMLLPKRLRSPKANLPPSPNRSKLRSQFFQGVASAMANQWS